MMKDIKVLIADDLPLMRQMLTTYLSELGYQDIVQAKDGRSAVSLSELHQIDISFLDINMPGLDGLAALKRIKEGSPDAYIVIVSGDSTLENIQAAIAAGASGFIVKPIHPQKITDALRNYEKLQSVTDEDQ